MFEAIFSFSFQTSEESFEISFDVCYTLVMLLRLSDAVRTNTRTRYSCLLLQKREALVTNTNAVCIAGEILQYDYYM